ncbi:hypothetical protein JCM3766R1_003373 [Sporobolomyces carnicolor]
MPSKPDSERPASALLLKPEILIGTPSLWWIGLVTAAFLDAFAKLGVSIYSMGFCLQREIKEGDIVVG